MWKLATILNCERKHMASSNPEQDALERTISRDTVQVNNAFLVNQSLTP